ncbi:MAG: tetratricopeptide repeat protein [Spirochaeta sp.]|nr:tetratricopeptide repeat protein [Spirochaeta sp.]
MNRKTVFIIAALFLAVAVASNLQAQSFILQYSEGRVELQSQNQWVPVCLGDTVERGDVLRLSAGAYAELDDGVRTLRLAETGIFRLSNLVEGRSRQTERNLSSMLRDRLDLLTGSQDRRTAGIGGIRGDENLGPEGLDWVDGESAPELVVLGREALAAGDPDQARHLFEDAVLFAFPGEEPEATFYLGYMHYLDGEMRQARALLGKYPPMPDSEYYHEHVLVLAHTELELSMAIDAIDLLHRYVADARHDTELVPTAHLLMGLGYRMSGDPVAAKEQLQHVQTIAPDTTTATTAAELLADL